MADWGEDAGPSRFFKENAQSSWIAQVRPCTTKPIVGVGRFTSPDTMVDVIRQARSTSSDVRDQRSPTRFFRKRSPRAGLMTSGNASAAISASHAMSRRPRSSVLKIRRSARSTVVDGIQSDSILPERGSRRINRRRRVPRDSSVRLCLGNAACVEFISLTHPMRSVGPSTGSPNFPVCGSGREL